ncbi:MAG: 2OG-Fe(II) oxygenase [Acetobacter sp.]|uniref:2OG-Fe(II) oxygenase n=1 Tax=Acetobacter sp. TaxID=440 RepID=UPI0039EC2925
MGSDTTLTLHAGGFSLPETLAHTPVATYPFAHWQLENVLPPAACDALVAWNPGEGAVAGDVGGRRETRNAHRVFVDPATRAREPRLDAMAHQFDAAPMRQAFETVCGTSLDTAALRLELCLDTDGFWLAPHTDIGAKKLTLLVSLSEGEGAEDWGTDLMLPDGASAVRAPALFNSAVLFIPSDRTWHGFVRRPIQGTRRTLIVNYVDESWRAVHELAFGPRSATRH